MISASIMAANMWENSMKNVESANNKILYETPLDFFFGSEMVFTFWISLIWTVHTSSDKEPIFWRQNNVRPWIWTYKFHNGLEICWLAEWLSVSEERFCSMESVTACQNIQSNLSPSKKILSSNTQQFQPSCHLLKHCWQSPFQRMTDSCNTPFSIIGTCKYPLQLKVIFISIFNPFHNQGITAT
jgi:hypothetical protein